MPVAEDTFGGTPIANKSGLKITPPPSPRAPATHPPANPRVRTFLSVLPSNTRSLLERLIFPYFFFNYYSFDTSLTAITTNDNMTMKKNAKKTQSAVLHFLNPISLEEPLSRL